MLQDNSSAIVLFSFCLPLLNTIQLTQNTKSKTTALLLHQMFRFTWFGLVLLHRARQLFLMKVGTVSTSCTHSRRASIVFQHGPIICVWFQFYLRLIRRPDLCCNLLQSNHSLWTSVFDSKLLLIEVLELFYKTKTQFDSNFTIVEISWYSLCFEFMIISVILTLSHYSENI